MNKDLRAHYNRIRRAKEALDNTKICTACEKRKPLSQFHNQSDRIDGKASQCAQCTNEKHRRPRKDEYPKIHPVLQSFLRT